MHFFLHNLTFFLHFYHVKITLLCILAVSEELVVLLQDRHELREQVDMRRIAVEQLVRIQGSDLIPSGDILAPSTPNPVRTPPNAVRTPTRTPTQN